MADHVEQIKSRLDIVDIISGYIKLQKSGVNYKACCPFHNEKTPSFYVSTERQIWHCFGCSKGGDMFGFIKEVEGVEFPEALRILAYRAGVTIDTYDPAANNAKNRLYQACELATKFFEKQLYGSATGKTALKYLTDRGLTEETLKEFRLGFAPNDWHALGEFLYQSGYSEKEIVDAGLAIRKNSATTNSTYDRFRSRITFPILDHNGQVVGFTARIFDVASPMYEAVANPTQSEVSVGAKYINTPQTLIYDKSSVLYGLYKAKAEIKQTNRCLLVEGNMDALMSYQAGAKNVVATSGTALTTQHLRLLRRYTQHLDFCFDADQAGALATRRGIGLALSQNFNVRVVQIQDKQCKDPADYVLKHGAGWSALAADSKPVIDFYFDRVRTVYDPLSPDSKKSVIAVIAPLVKRLVSHVEKAHWVARIANLLRVKEEAVEMDIVAAFDDLGEYGPAGRGIVTDTISRNTASNTTAHLPGGPVTDVSHEALLSLVLKKIPLFKERLAGLDYELLDSSVADVLRRIAALPADKLQAGAAACVDEIIRDRGNSMQLEFAYMRSQELWKEFSDSELEGEFDVLLSKIQQKGINAKLAGLEIDIKQAEAAGDKERLSGLMVRFGELAGQLAVLQRV